MTKPSLEESACAAVRRNAQEICDLLLLSDEMEMGRIPSRDGVSALRMAAGVAALTKALS